MSRAALAAAPLLLALGCKAPPPPARDAGAPAARVSLLDELRRFEEDERAKADFAKEPPWSANSGDDPWKLERVGDQLAVLWRDGKLTVGNRELAVPHGAKDLRARGSALITAARNTLVVWRPQGTERVKVEGALELSSADASEDLQVRYAVDPLLDRLFVVHLSGEVLARFPTCRGPEEVFRLDDELLIRCLLDHRVDRVALDAQGLPQPGATTLVQHDGPIWGMRALNHEGERLLLVAGVEDAPLDRTIGSFGQVDSFLWLYRGAARTELNLGEHGVVTPRAIRATVDGGQLSIHVVGNGGPWAARVSANLNDGALSVEERIAVTPGVVDLIEHKGELLFANPILDQVRAADGSVRARGMGPADPRITVGEALFFTHLMAPPQSSEGKRSRFTCETCHFEGGVDGRVHHTGRGEVRVSTKTLRGLFNNRPHFSRALDESMAKMVHNEFRVAHANTDGDPLGGRSLADYPWLGELGVANDLDAADLRRALMRFLMVFQHEPNPRTRGRASYTAQERKGAELFRDKCARCHAARLVTDAPSSERPFSEWEAQVFGASNLVWASERYEKTGVTPYVHERGARVPSLRRAIRKRPYLTSGQAADLGELLRMVGTRGGDFFHAGAPTEAKRLSATERGALRAFLELL